MSERHPETPWRQGYVLTATSAQKLNLVHPDGEADDPIVLMISHDCDLAAPLHREPDCEVIVGRHIQAVDGACTNGKNTRKLHLTFSGGSVSIAAEFSAIDKHKISKAVMAEHAPSEKVRLTRHEFSIVQKWLAARYRRSAFADEFEARFKRGRLYKKFTEIISRSERHILAVFFDVDAGEEIKRDGREILIP